MNDQPKHTPGPWHTGTSEDKNFCVWGEPDHRQGGFSECCICQVSPVSQLTSIDQANARLIAAAPDLLEAAQLQERHEWAKRNLESIGADPLNPERLALVMEIERTGSAANMARKSAIAKAEGRGE